MSVAREFVLDEPSPKVRSCRPLGVTTIEHGSHLDEEAAEKLLMVANDHSHALKLAIANGVRIAAGCDIFVSGSSYRRNSLEIRHLVDAGMTEI